MKRILINTFALSASMLLLCNCYDGLDEVYSEHFIQKYTIPKKFQAHRIAKYDNVIEVYCASYGEAEGVGYRFADKIEYDMYCKKYGDMSYNRKIMASSTRAIAPELVAINIICHKDYDSEHPAGTPLNDIVRLHAYSAYDYIKQGYAERLNYYPEGFIEYDGYFYASIDGFQPVTMMLNDLKLDDLKLLKFGFFLQILKIPEPGQYDYTITITTADLQKFECTARGNY